MIAKCANPACSTRFLYLHEGKLFRFERETKENSGPLLGIDTSLRKHSRSVEFHWLCATCAMTMTLVRGKGGTITIRDRVEGFRAAS